VLAPGGQGMIVEFHPFGQFAKRGGQRMRSIESNLRKFEEYYRLCRKAGLRIVDLRESFIDESARALFGEDEIAAYRQLKGTPLLAFFFVYKLRRRPQASAEGGPPEVSEVSRAENI
jgi:hypothetical protein